MKRGKGILSLATIAGTRVGPISGDCGLDVDLSCSGRGHSPGVSFADSAATTCLSFIQPFVGKLLSPPTMSPHNDPPQHNPVIKSESPPLQSVPISSIRQSHAQYPDSPHFRFGTKDQNALPPFSFVSRSESSPSSLPQHSAMSHLASYSSSLPASQSHFAIPPVDDPALLTATDEYDDGDEPGDFGSGSSSKMLDKAVRRRSSKGPSPSFVPVRSH
jgi:hypothetical protein